MMPKAVLTCLTERQRRVLQAYINGKEKELRFWDRKYLCNLLAKLTYSKIKRIEEDVILLKRVFNKRVRGIEGEVIVMESDT